MKKYPFLPCEQSLLRSSYKNREEEGDSACGLHFLWSADHQKTWMSHSSFEPVVPVCPLYECLIVGTADCFHAHSILFTIDQQTSLWKSQEMCYHKSSIGLISRPLSSLTEPQSRSFFNFLSGNDTFVSLPTAHEKSLFYQICPVVARKLVSTEKCSQLN